MTNPVSRFIITIIYLFFLNVNDCITCLPIASCSGSHFLYALNTPLVPADQNLLSYGSLVGKYATEWHVLTKPATDYTHNKIVLAREYKRARAYHVSLSLSRQCIIIFNSVLFHTVIYLHNE